MYDVHTNCICKQCTSIQAQHGLNMASVILLTLSACARGLWYLLCVCACVCVPREYILLMKFNYKMNIPVEFLDLPKVVYFTRFCLVSTFGVQVSHFPSATQGEELRVFFSGMRKLYIECARCRNDRVNSRYD